MVKEYILGDRKLTPDLVKLLHCLKFDQLDIQLRNDFLLRYCCPRAGGGGGEGGTHLLIPWSK